MDTNILYAILILSTLLLCILFIEFTRKSKIDFFLVFNLSYAMFFGLFPIIILINSDLLSYNTPANWAFHFEKYKDNSLLASIYALFFYMAFSLTYILISKKRFISKDIKEKAINLSNNTVFILGICFLFFGIASFFIYSTSMGGPVEAIRFAQAKRSGVFETSGFMTFFKHFMRSVYFGFFVLLTVKPGNIQYKKIRFIFIPVAIVSTIIVMLAYSGRANMLIVIVTVIFYKNIINNKIFLNKKQVFMYAGFLVFFGLISAYYRPFMNYLGGREVVFESSDSLMQIFTSVVKSFSVPFISLLVALEEFSFGSIRVGFGFMQIFIDIFPKSIVNADWVYTINNMNTELFGYVLDRRNYNIPSGLLAYFYYEFYWFGIFVGGAICGFIIKLLDDLFYSLKVNKSMGIILAYFMFSLPDRILAGDQVGGFKSLLILYLEFAVLYFVIKSTKINEVKIETSNLEKDK